MTADLAMRLLGDLLMVALLVGAPLLGVTMLTGLIISILQVVTQVQEMSLTFIPKLIAAGIVVVLFGPWMLRKLTAYATTLIGNIPAYF